MNDFIFIIEGAKSGIGESGFYHFFDNATVGAFFGTFVAIIVGLVVASWQYRKQKDIDRLHLRQDEIVNEIILLKSKVENANFKLQNLRVRIGIFGTEKLMKNKDEEMMRLGEAAIKDLNDFNFYVKNKIKTLLELYFYNKEKKLFEKVESEINNLLSSVLCR